MIQVLIPTLRQPCFALISPPAPDILLRIATATTVLILLAAAIAACSPLGILNSLTPTAAYRASVDVAYGPEPYPEYSQPVLWGRLLLQVVLAGLAFWFTRPRRSVYLSKS